jgi:peptide deformylase
MEIAQPLTIVPVSEIPVAQDVVLENLFKIYKTCLQLKDLCEEKIGIGISAVQAGIPMKLFAVKFPKGEYAYYANCEYRSSPGAAKILHIEGCLSLKTEKGKLKTYEVHRYKDVLINGYQIEEVGNDLVLKQLQDYPVSGFYAAVFQHEIDHHFGILISDIGNEVDLTPADFA